jgi:predicted nucleic acid-binding protein
LSDKLEKNELAQLITYIIEEKKPQTIKQLVILVKEKLQISEQEIVGSILKLQSEGKISFTKKPSQTPPKLAAYLKTEQTLWYWATIIIAVVTVATVFMIQEDLYPWVYLRYVLGTIFVLWLPGYSFIKALFPTQVPIKVATETLDTILRIALSLGMSLALVPMVGLLLNYTPWGVRLTPIVLSLLALTIVFSTAAMIREHQNRMKATKSTVNVE